MYKKTPDFIFFLGQSNTILHMKHAYPCKDQNITQEQIKSFFWSFRHLGLILSGRAPLPLWYLANPSVCIAHCWTKIYSWILIYLFIGFSLACGIFLKLIFHHQIFHRIFQLILTVWAWGVQFLVSSKWDTQSAKNQVLHHLKD